MPDGCRDHDLYCMEDILQRCTLGHLAMWADEELYVVPINYAYAQGKVLFHCALTGRKLDMMASNPQVCLEVSQQSGEITQHAGDNCSDGFESVICWGTARCVEDLEERAAVLSAFQRRYETPNRYIKPISVERASKCAAVEVTVTRMTGRRKGPAGHEQWNWGA